MKQIDISLISKYRMELMGVATIGILMCHAVGNNVAFPYYVSLLFSFGQTGNSLFMFLSGFGLYYSLSKTDSNQTSLLTWYKRRYARILIPYVLWYVVHFIRAFGSSDIDWVQFLFGFSLIKYWFHGGGAWFLSVLMPLYALSPVIKKFIIYKGATGRNVILLTTILTTASFFHSSNSFYEHILRAMPHFVGFILGMAAGYYSQEGKKVNVLLFWGYGVFLLLSFFILNRDFANFYLSWCLIFLPFLLYFFDSRKNTYRILRWFGKISLESYLTNGALPMFVKMIPWCMLSCNLNYGNYLGYSIVIIGGLLWAWGLHVVSQWILSKIKFSA